MMEYRKIERLEDGNWVVVGMSELKKGDTFQVSESYAEDPFGTFIATEDATTTEHDVWGVNCEEIV